MDSETSYRCRKCRTTLCTLADVIPHDPENENMECTSLFLADVLEWMGSLDENKGKLMCPKCQSRVGQYWWSGSKCSCGKWMVPALQLQKAKMDKVVRAGKSVDAS